MTKDTEESATQDGSGEDVATTFILRISFLGNLSTLVKRAEIFAQWWICTTTKLAERWVCLKVTFIQVTRAKTEKNKLVPSLYYQNTNFSVSFRIRNVRTTVQDWQDLTSLSGCKRFHSRSRITFPLLCHYYSAVYKVARQLNYLESVAVWPMLSLLYSSHWRCLSCKEKFRTFASRLVKFSLPFR